MGSADTFYLDGSAHRLEAAMRGLGARTDLRHVEGRGHFDLYTVGDDRSGLYKAIAREMYALARPGSKPPSVSASPRTGPPEAGRVGQLGRGGAPSVILVLAVDENVDASLWPKFIRRRPALSADDARLLHGV